MMMLKQTAVLLLISAFELGFINAFRSDYTYIESTKAFYKYHTEEALWLDAKTTCQTEGAVLFHPESKYELVQVLSGLAVKIKNEWINIGISDFAKANSYETTDGRPISQVYSKWQKGSPTCLRETNICHCGYLNIKNQELAMDPCEFARQYICKKRQPPEEIVMMTIEKINTDIGNASFVTSQLLANQSETIEVLEKEAESMKLQAANQSETIEVLEKEAESMKLQAANQSETIEVLEKEAESMKLQAANQSETIEVLEKEAESMKLQAANQSETIEVLEREAASMKLQAANQSETIEVLEREAASMKLQAANNSAIIDFMRRELEGMKKAHAVNLTSVLERIAEANANQATASKRIAEADTNLAKAMQQQIEANKLQAANQTAALERQAMALEKLANLLGSNDQLDERSQH